jgi:ubiquinone/menaquinone biosynthesis C-methylase UbiE
MQGRPEPLDRLLRHAAAGPLLEQVLRDPLHGEAVRYCLSELGSPAGLTVADMGCGTGGMSVLFALLGARVIGVDKSEDRLEKAEARALSSGVSARCTFLRGEAERTPLDAQSVDIVFSKSALQYMDRERALGEYLRVLKRNGTLILIENLPHNPLIGLYRLARRMRARRYRRIRYVRSIRGYLSFAEIRSLRASFSTLDYRTYHLFRMITIGLTKRSGGAPWAAKLDAAAAGLDRAVQALLPFTHRIAWLVAVVGKGRSDAPGFPEGGSPGGRPQRDCPALRAGPASSSGSGRRFFCCLTAIRRGVP